MKKLLVLAAMCCFATAAMAQYSKISYESDSAFKLLQIDQYDDASVFFFTVKCDEPYRRFSVNDNTKISIDGSYKKYRLMQVANIPFSSENCAACLDKVGDELYFILQFERIPLDKPFNIIENEGSTSAMAFNLHNITVDTGTSSDLIDMDDFLGCSDYVRTGMYSRDGVKYRYYDINGLSVAVHLGEEFFGLTRVGKLDVIVTNDSGRKVSLSCDNVRVTACRNEKKGYEEIPVWEVATYDSYVQSGNAASMASYSKEVNPAASSIGDYRKYRMKQDNVGGQILLGSIESLLRSSSKTQEDEYAAALEANRNRLWNNYLQNLDIDNGETYGGFVAFKDRKYQSYMIYITVGGHEYSFGIRG
ncbi:MAG: hypothetical protein KBT00_03410 [Bacteroidales bacterium]|nr:hypothetical protein [Candidatus Cacconaster merdequi]